MGATGGILMDLTVAEGAGACGLFLGFFFLLFERSEFVDAFYKEEKAQSGCGEIKYGLNERAVREGNASDIPDHFFKILGRSEDGDEGEKYGVDERGYDSGKRTADDHTNGEVNYIALEGKRLELGPEILNELFHVKTLLCISE